MAIFSNVDNILSLVIVVGESICKQKSILMSPIDKWHDINKLKIWMMRLCGSTSAKWCGMKLHWRYIYNFFWLKTNPCHFFQCCFSLWSISVYRSLTLPHDQTCKPLYTKEVAEVSFPVRSHSVENRWGRKTLKKWMLKFALKLLFFFSFCFFGVFSNRKYYASISSNF